MKVSAQLLNLEYEHLQFLWGQGQQHVIFPAILALLGEYSEIWHDANTEKVRDDETFRVKTVPWIKETEMNLLLKLGKKVIRDPITNAALLWGSSVSVQKALFYGMVKEDDREIYMDAVY